MNRALLAMFCFALSFAAGFLLVPGAREKTAESSYANRQTMAEQRKSPEEKTGIEFSDLAEMDDFAHLEPSGNLIDISETEGIYRESEVVAKSGEKWLTLQETNGSYSLIPRTAKLSKKRTVSYPGVEQDVELSFLKGGNPVFAVRNLTALQPGPVTTLYLRPSRKEVVRRNLPIDAMKTGFEREFNLNDVWYTLRVSRGRTTGGTIIGVLVLESEGVAQVIARNSYEQGFGEIIGDLLWVGDLDGDRKLDLYFDEFNEKGYFGVGLYLSSSAEEGGLVKLVATFTTAGC